MFNKGNNLFNFKLDLENDFIEIGGGEGDLSNDLIKLGCNVVLFIEPDKKKYKIALNKLKNVQCINVDVSKIDFAKIPNKSSNVTVIMQDVIEHISKVKQKKFFNELRKRYERVSLIGRTPNLKSPFGLRNSFGDNTHLHRFTDISLKDFLIDLDFKNIYITSEPYQITGITSSIRYLPYLLSIYFISIIFLFVFGRWEGLLSPNLVFNSNNI